VDARCGRAVTGARRAAAGHRLSTGSAHHTVSVSAYEREVTPEYLRQPGPARAARERRQRSLIRSKE